MSPELQQQLFAKYPEFFEEHDLPAPFHWRSRPDEPCVGVQCRDGWYDLIDSTIAAIMLIDPSVRVSQIKEMAGDLVIHVNTARRGDLETPRTPNEVRVEQMVVQVLYGAREKSRRICEECGRSGMMRVLDGHVATRCDEHARRLW